IGADPTAAYKAGWDDALAAAPAATVVDEVANAAFKEFKSGQKIGETESVFWTRIARAALSGVSAPVGVEAVLRRIVAEADTHPFNPVGHVIEHVVPEARTVVAQEKAHNEPL